MKFVSHCKYCNVTVSVGFTGVGGDSSGQEDVLCCGWGPVSDDHSSYGFFPADLSPGCCSGKCCPLKIDSQNQ